MVFGSFIELFCHNESRKYDPWSKNQEVLSEEIKIQPSCIVNICGTLDAVYISLYINFQFETNTH